ncbi:MAG: DUF4861 domain-containing protein [Flavobacteriales bacterium]|nr:DUF4861 domain-containing protein [Flavobacteriales bacterium]NCP59898.1 DUF4861 domain-containing protein [Flavobacteriales bacterium]PIV94820.1 MAG: DUF4861 domain-containing protein [Flavobacteriaceae bacterium CG17_big_fil_post_rev_8_21_14_2_50_33_15]
MVVKTSIRLVAVAIILFNCSQNEHTKTITVKNTLDMERTFETVELSKDFLKIDDLSSISIQDSDTKKLLVTQTIDYDGDGVLDVILFQPQVEANSEKVYEIVKIQESERPKADTLCYSRFVPERTDDYTWENNRVAFRTYGPTAQKMIEDNIPGGTLSSGIDLWLKKVDYSIIDKWYAGNVKKSGYYHIDHGEGYDPYHVGKSRGTGGIGVWKGDTLLTSKNFTAYRTIAIGPLRTVFELDYEPWSEYGIKETKRISLDLGSNFSKFEISLVAENPVPNYTIGITLHDGKGDIILNDKDGYYGHWEAIDNSFVGEGIILDPQQVQQAFDFRTSTPDQSQLLIITEPNQTKLTYYAGFAWTKGGDVTTKENWIQMLDKESKKINNPLQVRSLNGTNS